MKISCVVDNHAKFSSNFYSEHGFSLLLEMGNEKIMMDAGKTPTVFKHNFDLMGVGSADKVVFSHGHNDHTGGVSVLLNSGAKFFMHPDALTPKYAVEGDKSRYIGFPKSIDPTKTNMNFNFVTETIKIGNKFWIFNQIDTYCDFETIPKYLSIKKGDKFVKDEFIDELNLVVETDEGLVVISGCAHRGMVNILYSAREYFQEKIWGIIGGSHLVRATPQRIKKTIDEFKKIDPGIIALGHCTGFEALCRFKKEFKGKFIPLESGAEFMLTSEMK